MWTPRVQFLFILDLGTRWGDWSGSRPRPHFAPGERTLGIHWIGVLVGLRAGLNTEATGKIRYQIHKLKIDR
jgi:hypothetical protein